MKSMADPHNTQKLIDKEVNLRVKEEFEIYSERFYVCMAMSMCDEGGIDPTKVMAIAEHSTKLIDEVTEGRISFDDMKKTLWDEFKIGFEFRRSR